MAITQLQIAALPDYTWAEIAKMAKAAMVAVTVSQQASFMGNNVTRADLEKLTDLYNTAIANANAEAATDTGGGIALVQYGERV